MKNSDMPGSRGHYPWTDSSCGVIAAPDDLRGLQWRSEYSGIRAKPGQVALNQELD